MAMKTCRITDVPQVGSSDTIYDPAYLQPKIFQLSSVSRIFQQYGMLLKLKALGYEVRRMRAVPH